MESASTDIQIAADAAARAASRKYVTTGDKQAALVAAQELAQRNPVGDFVVPITMSDLDFGISNRTSANAPYTFNNTGNGNSVRLTTRTLAIDGNGIDPVFPFFGGSFQIRPERTAVSTQGVIDVALGNRSQRIHGLQRFGSGTVSAGPSICTGGLGFR